MQTISHHNTSFTMSIFSTRPGSILPGSDPSSLRNEDATLLVSEH